MLRPGVGCPGSGSVPGRDQAFRVRLQVSLLTPSPTRDESEHWQSLLGLCRLGRGSGRAAMSNVRIVSLPTAALPGGESSLSSN